MNCTCSLVSNVVDRTLPMYDDCSRRLQRDSPRCLAQHGMHQRSRVEPKPGHVEQRICNAKKENAPRPILNETHSDEFATSEITATSTPSSSCALTTVSLALRTRRTKTSARHNREDDEDSQHKRYLSQSTQYLDITYHFIRARACIDMRRTLNAPHFFTGVNDFVCQRLSIFCRAPQLLAQPTDDDRPLLLSCTAQYLQRSVPERMAISSV
ncbi:uncharacterized protein B0J16DRAFT_181897 [Fusarium flagelliforme]|uniref:uncharacterized protein n=1 Tax=Fusarium flagelliforme TaxID=2675880 RepID=UPI001E8E6368|nr:uncharacterized protein B0J16DRAFT_181897 [Fusarium flagelliforme]KAH7174404.1 hypothetical protein B0J16DRAFT_181897 [Fusarium flagelliforme]